MIFCKMWAGLKSFLSGGRSPKEELKNEIVNKFVEEGKGDIKNPDFDVTSSGHYGSRGTKKITPATLPQSMVPNSALAKTLPEENGGSKDGLAETLPEHLVEENTTPTVTDFTKQGINRDK